MPLLASRSTGPAGSSAVPGVSWRPPLPVGLLAVVTALLAACSSAPSTPLAGGATPSAATSPTSPTSPTVGPSSLALAVPAPAPMVTGPVGESVGASVGTADDDLVDPGPALDAAPVLPVPAPAVWPPADPVPASQSWSAELMMLSGHSGPVSPTGLVALAVQDGRVCLEPTVLAPGPTRCVLDLDDAAAPTWWAFAPGGLSAVVVSGPPSAATVSLLDAVEGTVRTVLPPGSVGDARWSLSSAVWDGDDALLVIPEVVGATGDVLRVDRATGRIDTVLTGLAADITAAGPEMWATAGQLFLSPTTGLQLGHVWAVDRTTGVARDVGVPAGPGERLSLQGADPGGVWVMTCPVGTDGSPGPLVRTRLATNGTVQVFDSTTSCSAVAWSQDSAYVAFTVDTPGGDLLQILHPSSGTLVYAEHLGVEAPPAAPMMTWRGDTLVLTDGTGTWVLPTLVLTLTF